MNKKIGLFMLLGIVLSFSAVAQTDYIDSYSAKIDFNGCNPDLAIVTLSSSDGEEFKIPLTQLTALYERSIRQYTTPAKKTAYLPLPGQPSDHPIDSIEAIENKHAVDVRYAVCPPRSRDHGDDSHKTQAWSEDSTDWP